MKISCIINNLEISVSYGAKNNLKHLEKIFIGYDILDETSEFLRMYGTQKCEGFLLWLGFINDDNIGYVKKILNPPQNSIQSEDGVGYFITAETLFSMNKFLSSSGFRMLAQVHSHPGQAYHSPADDRYCIATAEGSFSIVVPNFGFGPSDLSRWAIYRLINGIWEKLPKKTVESMFIIEGLP